MIVGFKTGPGNWEIGKRIVEEDEARMCEVWFNVLKAENYLEMFEWLKARRVAIGLHHWGLAGGNMKTNLMTNDEAVRIETLRQMRETIDIAAEINAVYVNVHPGARFLETIDFATRMQGLFPGTETSEEEAENLLLSAAQELEKYAAARNVVFTVETLPAREWQDNANRKDIYNPNSADLSMMRKLTEAGIFIANDITHTAGQCAAADNDRTAMWKCILSFSQAVWHQTKLLHINTVRKPFDGSDSHDGILPEDFTAGVFPDAKQLKGWLRLFMGRDDVFAIPEPEGDMRANYRALVQLKQDAVG